MPHAPSLDPRPAPVASDPRGPVPPGARGPVSAAVLDVIAGRRSSDDLPRRPDLAPFGDDLQLSLYLCYELHYRSFAGADPAVEWDPGLLTLRRHLEETFLAALREEVAGGDDVGAEVDALLVEPVGGSSPSHRLAADGTPGELREYVAHRSLYHLKEADPQAWVIPRIDGQAKASLVTVEHDEFGAGRAERVHAQLFADMMEALGLDSRYGAYLDVAPAITLATVNVMSLFGLHRRWRGASVGQFAVVEITSSPGSARLVSAMTRLGESPTAIRFYDEHVEADAVHEQLVRRGLLADLLEREPDLAPDIVFGIQAPAVLEQRLDDHLLRSWDAATSSLRRPLPA